MSLKNMTEEEKKARKRKQKAEAQKRYYQKNKDYYKNYSKQWSKELLKSKDKQIEIMEKYFELIIDLGYDYDGLSSIEDLRNLIDELVRYASLGRVCNTTEAIYVNQEKKYNILGEMIKSDN